MLLHNPDKAAHPGYPYRPTSNETFTVLWFLHKAGGGNKLSLFTMHSLLLSQVPWNRLQKALVLASISFLFVGLPIAKASRHCFPKRPLVLSSDAQRTIQERGVGGWGWVPAGRCPLENIDGNCQLPTCPLLLCCKDTGEAFSFHFPEEQTEAEHSSSISSSSEGVHTLGSLSPGFF